jgi:hypothetical protein
MPPLPDFHKWQYLSNIQLHYTNAVSEIDTYFSKECVGTDKDPLEFLSANSFRFPYLDKQAKIYLAHLLLRKDCFSVAGKIFKPDRCMNSDLNFEVLMMIKCNQDNQDISDQHLTYMCHRMRKVCSQSGAQTRGPFVDGANALPTELTRLLSYYLTLHTSPVP